LAEAKAALALRRLALPEQEPRERLPELELRSELALPERAAWALCLAQVARPERRA
jgi:hypothetical protein